MKRFVFISLLMCLPMWLCAQGTLTAYYANEGLENYEAEQLIVDTNDPINRIVEFSRAKYKYEGDESGGYYYQLIPKVLVTVKQYQMSPLPEALVRDGATFVSSDGFTVRIFAACANGHGFYGFDDDFQPCYDAEQTAVHQQYYVLSGTLKTIYDPEGFFFEDPLAVEDGNIKLYIDGSEIGYTVDDPDEVRYRPYKMGFIEEKWMAPEDYGYGNSAYDSDGNLLVDLVRIIDIPTALSIAYIEAEDALYINGTLYYRQ